MVVGLLYTAPINGVWVDDNQFFSCPNVCARDRASGGYRYIQIINNDRGYYSCNITATNGANYSNIMVAPGTLTRYFTINDSRARYAWECYPV